MARKRIIYLDLGAINKDGKKNFLNSESWPVKEKYFWKFIDFIFENYYNSLKKLNGRDFHIGVIEVAFLNNLIQVLHINYVKEYAKKNKIKILNTKISQIFFKPDWNNIANFYKIHSYPYNKFNRFLRKIFKAIYFNRHLPLYKIIIGIFSKNKNISLGSFDNIKKDYIFKTNNFYNHIAWVDLLNKNWQSKFDNKKVMKQVNSFSKIILQPMLLNIKKNKFTKEFAKSLDFNKIQKAWEVRIKDLYILQEVFCPSESVKELLITECGKPFHKLIAASYKEKKTIVTNFSHGNDPSFVDQRWTHNYLISVCNRYAFESHSIKKSFNRIRKNFILDFKENIKYLSIDSPIYNRLKNHTNLIKNNNNVMLMGYPMNSKRYVDDVYHFFHYKLKLEIHLLNELKKTSNNIIYKAHPDRINELGNIMKQDSVNIISEKFENVWKQAGVLIFTYVTTTTFGFAIQLPVPIILIAPESTKWIKERKKILEKRVVLISNSDENNYMKINKLNLENAIKLAKKRVDLNVAKKLID